MRDQKLWTRNKEGFNCSSFSYQANNPGGNPPPMDHIHDAIPAQIHTHLSRLLTSKRKTLRIGAVSLDISQVEVIFWCLEHLIAAVKMPKELKKKGNCLFCEINAWFTPQTQAWFWILWSRQSHAPTEYAGVHNNNWRITPALAVKVIILLWVTLYFFRCKMVDHLQDLAAGSWKSIPDIAAKDLWQLDSRGNRQQVKDRFREVQKHHQNCLGGMCNLV